LHNRQAYEFASEITALELWRKSIKNNGLSIFYIKVNIILVHLIIISSQTNIA